MVILISVRSPKNVDDLKPAPWNPRRLSEHAAELLDKSIMAHGNIANIVWNCKSGFIVAGHQRVERLKKLGATFRADPPRFELNGESFPIRTVDWSPEQEKLANIAANSPHAAGEFDYPQLKDLITELDTGAVDMDLSGFGEMDIKVLFENEKVEPDALPQEKPPIVCPKCGHKWRPGSED